MYNFIFFHLFPQDCHGIGGDNNIPVQDDTQNVLIDEGYQNGTHTQIQFRRPLETCDPHDVTINVSLSLNRVKTEKYKQLINLIRIYLTLKYIKKILFLLFFSFEHTKLGKYNKASLGIFG